MRISLDRIFFRGDSETFWLSVSITPVPLRDAMKRSKIAASDKRPLSNFAGSSGMEWNHTVIGVLGQSAAGCCAEGDEAMYTVNNRRGNQMSFHDVQSDRRTDRQTSNPVAIHL